MEAHDDFADPGLNHLIVHHPLISDFAWTHPPQ